MKKLVSAILLFSVLASIAACGDDDAGNVTDTSDTTTGTDETLPAGIEKKNYDAQFNILAPEWGLYPNYFFADEENRSEAMGKALYERELSVEEYLGVDITHTIAGDYEAVRPALVEATMSGDDMYQLALTHCISGTAAMITEGLIIDMNDIDTINFGADWWNHTSNANLAVNGKQFYAISDYMLPDPNVFLFNKELVDKHRLEDPYTLVREGKWTLDKLGEMSAAVTNDNGDGVWDINDTYGFGAPDNWFLVEFIQSSGIFMVDRNENNELQLAFGDERTFDLMEKLDSILNGPDTYVYYHTADYDTSQYDKSLNISTGRCLFNVFSLNLLHTLRDSNVEYGILPFPKYDEEQEEYYSLDWSGMMCVPSSVDPATYDMVGEVIELLSYHSADTSIPAYFDIVLDEKLSRDDDSKEMLNIVFDSIVYDAGMNYFGFDKNFTRLLYTTPFHIVATGQNNFSSWLAQYQPGAQLEIAAFNEAVAELD